MVRPTTSISSSFLHKRALLWPIAHTTDTLYHPATLENDSTVTYEAIEDLHTTTSNTQPLTIICGYGETYTNLITISPQ